MPGVMLAGMAPAALLTSQREQRRRQALGMLVRAAQDAATHPPSAPPSPDRAARRATGARRVRGALLSGAALTGLLLLLHALRVGQPLGAGRDGHGGAPPRGATPWTAPAAPLRAAHSDF